MGIWLGFLLAVGVLLLVRAWYQRLDTNEQGRWRLRLGLALLILVVLVTILTGRAQWLLALLLGAIPLLRRVAYALPVLRQLLQWLRGTKVEIGEHGESDRVKTYKDPATGKLDGEILCGQFQGKKLSELSFSQLTALLDACPVPAADDTRRYLQAFLAQHHGQKWQQWRRQSDTGMTLSEACQILGLDPEEQLERRQIIAAHKRLIGRLHPDQGGSDYLAARVNQARDFLLMTMDS